MPRVGGIGGSEPKQLGCSVTYAATYQGGTGGTQKTTSRKDLHVARNCKGYRVGAAHHNSKADDDEVRLALELRNRYGMGYKLIAKKLERPVRTIRDWCSGKSRSQIPTN